MRGNDNGGAGIADPTHPRLRDEFVLPSGNRVTLVAVGDKWAIGRYPQGAELPFTISEIATWQPAPSALVTEDVTLWKSINGHWFHDAVVDVPTTSIASYRSITLRPNGTWTEAPR
jgi:hypothetical protein